MSHETESGILSQRRELLKGTLCAVIAIPVASILGCARARAADLQPLDEKDPQAKALGYVADAARVDSKTNPTFKSGQACANCLQLQGKAGDPMRPCNLFPGKLVNANGWCKAWVKKA
jgi:hypothetical protein